MPHFSFGDKQQGGVGQGEGEVGDPSARVNRARRRPGRRRRRPASASKSMSRWKNWPRSWARNSSSPTSSPRARRISTTRSIKYTGIRRRVPSRLRHFKRTYKEALKRADCHRGSTIRTIRSSSRSRKTSGTASASASPMPEGQRRHHLHDGRLGSMGDEQKEIVRMKLLDRYLAAHAIQRHRTPLHHSRCRRRAKSTRHLLSHTRERRHADQLGLQAVRSK